MTLLYVVLVSLVLSKVLGDKGSLRATCRGLRLAVNAWTSALTWTRPRTFATCRQTRALPVFLPASLSASCPGIRRLDCGGWLGDEPLLGVRLAALPTSIHTLICSHTNIQRLGPLAAWTMLQTLDCSGTKVATLGPLAACTSLRTLNCSRTRVAELGPLAACTSLQTLDCSVTEVAELGPLAACPALQALDWSTTQVEELSPLTGCTLLQSLNCSRTQVADLSPLAACRSLQRLYCYDTFVEDVGPLVAACTSLVWLECPPLVPHAQTQLLKEACRNLEDMYHVPGRSCMHPYF